VGNVAALSGAGADAGRRGASGRGGRGAFAGRGGPAGGGLLVGQRYRGQEGAPDDAPVFSNLGSIGVVGFMMQDLDADPLDFDIDRVRARREEVSRWLDSTDPDLRAFHDRGGKLIVIVGTDDTTAPSGEQLNYYQTVIDVLGREVVDQFARLYVLPQTGHGLAGRSAPIDGAGELVETAPIPNTTDRFALLQNWVEHDVAPGTSETVTGDAGSRPLCSYPRYPHYQSGDPTRAESYRCAEPASYE
jgi:feruloyl esterase